jgi:hypothetical protein
MRVQGLEQSSRLNDWLGDGQPAGGRGLESRSSIEELLETGHLCGLVVKDPEVQVRFPALPEFLRSSGFGAGSTQPHGYFNFTDKRR